MPKVKRSTKEDVSEVPSPATVLFLFGTIADTTWRMFVPIVGLAILGVWLDNTIHTKPWLTMIGIIIGMVAASILIIRQINKE